jgi:hypothetical protein
MPLPIAIDVGVPEPPRELSTVLVESCTRAAVDTSCYLVKDAPDGPSAALAIITWERDDKVRIEVGLQREHGTEWRQRQLSFQPADVALERYRSVGFVVGTLATASKDEPPDPEPAPAEPEPEPEQPPPVVAPVPTPKKSEPAPLPPAAPEPSHGFLGISAIAGRAVDRGGLRFGGNVRLGLRVLPRLTALVTAGLATRPRDEFGLRITWVDAGAGAAFTLGSPVASHVEVRLELLAEQFSAEARTTRAVATRARVLPTLRPGLDGVLRLGSFLDVVGGLDLTGRPALTWVNVEGTERLQTHYVEFGASLGARGHF